MKLKIRPSYRKGSDTYVLKTGNRVSTSLKGNTDLPNPAPTIEDLDKVCQEFSIAISRAGRNDRTLASAKNDKKAELIAMLDKVADYVTVASKGDKTILLSSGFDIIGLKAAEKPLTPIDKLIVELGGPGMVTTRVRKVTGAKAYLHQYTPDPITPDSIWVSETTTDRENTFTNLKSITKYWFRVIAIGRGKQAEYSLPVSVVIQ